MKTSDLKNLLTGTPLWATYYSNAGVECKKVKMVSFNRKTGVAKVEDIKTSWISRSHGAAPIKRWSYVKPEDLEIRHVKYKNSDECATRYDETPEDFCY